MHEGHRQRMMQRLENGAETLQEHEVLEILLYYAIPRRNTNPIAHELIKAFGSLNGVLKASVEQLMSVNGVGIVTARYLNCLGLCYKRIGVEENKLPRCFNPLDFAEYLKKYYAGKQEEYLDIYCINDSGKTFFHKSFTTDNENKVVLDPTQVSRILVMQKPYAIIVSHNHPHSTSAPSAEDDRFTVNMQMRCSANNILFYDHFICGTDGVFSYYSVGKLERIKKDYNVSSILNQIKV